MIPVYRHKFTVTVYGTEELDRDTVGKELQYELQAMDFAECQVVRVEAAPGVVSMGLEDAVTELRSEVKDDDINELRAVVAGLEEREHRQQNDRDEKNDGEAAGRDAGAADGKEVVLSLDYHGPRWTYGSLDGAAMMSIDGFITCSIADRKGPPFNRPFFSADFTRRLRDGEAARNRMTLIDWPGRITEETIDAWYGPHGVSKPEPLAAISTKHALRALIEHAIRTAPDELAAAIHTAWAVHQQRGVEHFGEDTDELPKLIDILVFG